jgi:hypothetical protein
MALPGRIIARPVASPARKWIGKVPRSPRR